MVKKEENKKKYLKKEEEGVSKQTKYMSYFIIFIMIFSVAGFAILSGGGGSLGSSGTSTTRDLPLQADVFQNPQTGETYWGAVLNGEQFIFFNGVEGYELREDMKGIASQIKSTEFVNIYVDPNYQSSDAIYVVEKALTGLEISHQRITGNLSCTPNTLVFTNNMTVDGDCIVFVSPQGEEYLESDVLVYHLIK